MQIANIENWSIQQSNDNPFQAPELKKMRLCGDVYSHPNFEDGSYIATSSVQEIDLIKGEVITRNTIYQLGKIQEEYFKYCEENNVKDLELLKQYR